MTWQSGPSSARNLCSRVGGGDNASSRIVQRIPIHSLLLREIPLKTFAEPIKTERLTLIPSNAAHLRAELAGNDQFAALMNAVVPSSWPPGEYDRAAQEFFLARLSELGPEGVGWYGWYALWSAGAGFAETVIGGGGYFGPPSEAGVVEIGYSICPEWRSQGYATEMVKALAARASALPGVKRVIAHTSSDNVASVTVLTRSGFSCVGPGADPSLLQFVFAAAR
jgi:[ribosomal protein S5]-alanine N-acetyltransferase